MRTFILVLVTTLALCAQELPVGPAVEHQPLAAQVLRRSEASAARRFRFDSANRPAASSAKAPERQLLPEAENRAGDECAANPVAAVTSEGRILRPHGDSQRRSASARLAVRRTAPPTPM